MADFKPGSAAPAPHTGTTIVAAAYAGGVVLGADTRVTTGTYISNRTSDKITPLAENVFLCRSGSAADTQLVSDIGTCPHVAPRCWQRSQPGGSAGPFAPP
jgi:20S proteasome alpha/beta subunit